ncbi:MAG: TerB family tellurite resistance protein [Kiritimatiellia bacterium]
MVSPWITGALGWAFFGPLGGLFGYAAGSLFNAAQRGSAGNATGGAGPQAGPGAARNDFIASLLALTAAMMKADGRATKSELEVVKAFFAQQFGAGVAAQALQMLRDLLDKDIPVRPVCAQIRMNMNYSQRMALLHFLFSLAHADGELHPAEDRLLARLASELGIHAADVRSIAAMFAPKADPNADYRVLEVAPTASDDEVRRAYRRMSMKHHPDKVAHLGAEFQKTATEKFQRVNAAYAAIKKARGMS